MLIIRNCNLINMAGIYEEKKDLVVENGKILDICDNAVSKYNVGHVSIDACGHYVTPGFVEPHCQSAPTASVNSGWDPPTSRVSSARSFKEVSTDEL